MVGQGPVTAPLTVPRPLSASKTMGWSSRVRIVSVPAPISIWILEEEWSLVRSRRSRVMAPAAYSPRSMVTPALELSAAKSASLRVIVCELSRCW